MPLFQGSCELCHIENSLGSFMAYLVKEEHLYLLVPTSQSEAHSKTQETLLASKTKIFDIVHWNDNVYVMYFIYFVPRGKIWALPFGNEA